MARHETPHRMEHLQKVSSLALVDVGDQVVLAD